ncbi:hypothetical protein KEM54_003259 [Ascosphaera aggregata]|nr:hypothetical protein KEM54_003259 [Ascosphaera aggregata]
MAIGLNSRFTSLIVCAVVFISVIFFLNPTPRLESPKNRAPGHIIESIDHDVLSQAAGSSGGSGSRRSSMLEGPVVMPKLGNATINGECAVHFQHMLKSYPPQVSSRNAAAVWACDMHNKVNKKLRKPMFNCAEIGNFYDCGCADHEETGDAQQQQQQQQSGQRQASSAEEDDKAPSEPFSIHPEPYVYSGMGKQSWCFSVY